MQRSAASAEGLVAFDQLVVGEGAEPLALGSLMPVPDEAKWERSFNGGRGAVFVDAAQFDASANAVVATHGVSAAPHRHFPTEDDLLKGLNR